MVQLGTTGDTSTLLAAAKQLLDDQPEPEPEPAAAGHRTRRHRHHGIVAVDINMGCPKRVATSSGSGGALFADRERCEAAVRALREFLPAVIAVTCKVRLCADAAESLERCRGLVAAGAALGWLLGGALVIASGSSGAGGVGGEGGGASPVFRSSTP